MNANRLSDASLLIARVFLGSVIGAHGAQKLLGWFGGFGFEGTMGYFTDTIGLPYALAFLIIIAESLGMLVLIFGFATRLAATALVPIMLGAIVTTHGQFGFFMNWSGTQAGEGFEFHLLVMAFSLVIALNGAGAYSLDAYIQSKNSQRRSITKLLFG